MTAKEAIFILECVEAHGIAEDAKKRAIEALKADPQKAYEQGVKDTLDKYDETCRIASDIRCAMGCKTAKECRDLISNGEIQRVKHGHWIKRGENLYECSECGAWVTPSEYIPLELHKFCRGCGARMDLDEV